MPENKYLFVSDIHGYDLKLDEELSTIATDEKTPKIVFFLGDIVGTTLLDGLQKRFYNVFNKMKTLKDTSDEEIEKKVGVETNELNNYLHNISKEFYGISLVKTVKRVALYEHFGHFTSNLPEEIKRELRKDMEKNAKAMIDIMTKFIQNECMVIVVEGNWDARTPLDFYPTEKCQALPIEYRSFYFKNFLKSLNDKILYFDEVGTIETENETFVLWPFDCAVNIAQIPEFEDENTKKIIIVSHAQADWKAIKGDTPMTGESKKIEENMKIILQDLKPDVFIHGHLHDIADDYKLGKIQVHYLPYRIFRFINF